MNTYVISQNDLEEQIKKQLKLLYQMLEGYDDEQTRAMHEGGIAQLELLWSKFLNTPLPNKTDLLPKIEVN